MPTKSYDKRNRNNLRTWGHPAGATIGVARRSRLDVIVITHEKHRANGNAASILAEIAALPLEGAYDAFSGRDHDSVLYPKKPTA
jgi:hypothetical protein